MSRFVVHVLCPRFVVHAIYTRFVVHLASSTPPSLVDARRVSLAYEAKDEVLHESLDAISSMSAQHTELLDAMKASASEVDALKAALKVSCSGHIRGGHS